MSATTKSFVIESGVSIITPSLEPELLLKGDQVDIVTDTTMPRSRSIRIIGNSTRAGELAGYAGTLNATSSTASPWMGVLRNGSKAACGVTVVYLPFGTEMKIHITGIKPKGGSEDSAGEWEGMPK